MTENNHIADEVKLEPVGNDKFRVLKDGLPQTGPLTLRDAAKVAAKLDVKGSSVRGQALQLIAGISIVAGIVTGAISGWEFSTMALVAIVTGFSAMLAFLWFTN